MADKHPYVNGTGGLVHVLDHLKKSFPVTLDADVLRKLGFAPKNESYIINVVRFIKLIDENGSRTEKAQKVFTLHDASAFAKAFSEVVKSAYSDLFQLHGESAWTLDDSKLITYFRQTDQSSELVGKLQARTFGALAGYAGQGAAPAAGPKAQARPNPPGKPKRRSTVGAEERSERHENSPASAAGDGLTGQKVGLTVRIEINLPASGDQDTYDKIFKSIRENLLNG
jgi:hypothetical protein